jgi:hypothetical protein
MIDLYFRPTGNGKKSVILLEELGLPYGSRTRFSRRAAISFTSAHSSTCSEMLSASSTSMPR